METWWWIVWVGWIVVGFAVLYTMAKGRGRNPILWGIFGAISFLIALIAILIVGPAKDTATPAT